MRVVAGTVDAHHGILALLRDSCVGDVQLIYDTERIEGDWMATSNKEEVFQMAVDHFQFLGLHLDELCARCNVWDGARCDVCDV